MGVIVAKNIRYDYGKFIVVGGGAGFTPTASADWDLLQGSVAVSSEDADLVIGTLTKIATVEGTEIKVKQVEDMTKIEAVAVADTTEYADVTSLFTAPAGE